MALYKSGAKAKPSPDTMKRAITTSWHCYTSGIIAAAQPERVIVIGKGVARILQAELHKFKPYAIPQPQARLTNEEHLSNFKIYYHLCLPDNS